MNLYYFYLTFIAVLVYLVFQDPNVPKYIELRFKLMKINIIKYFMARKMKRQLDTESKKIKEWLEKNGKDKM